MTAGGKFKDGVVIADAKILILKQITTEIDHLQTHVALLLQMQRY